MIMVCLPGKVTNMILFYSVARCVQMLSSAAHWEILPVRLDWRSYHSLLTDSFRNPVEWPKMAKGSGYVPFTDNRKIKVTEPQMRHGRPRKRYPNWG
uniref:Uncharacterized protein n=1 Tax=Yersinia enterocolitica TaxID=630 RepID=B0RKP1_YEREN|nr:hypothetical protein [Yersinia enterocolitica]